jgi:hypothetical protein
MLGPSGLNDQPPENIDLYPGEDDDVRAPERPQTTLTKLRKGIVKIRYVGHISFSDGLNCGCMVLYIIATYYF